MKTRNTFINTSRALACALIALLGMAVIPTETYAKKKKDKTDDDIVIVKLDREPSFPGGDSAMFSWIDANLRYPPALKNSKKRGLVVVSFTVEPDGSLDNLRITKKFTDETNAEALRLVSAMPAWEPGLHDGKAVAVPMSIPIAFTAHLTKTIKKDETFATWLDRKIDERKRRKQNLPEQEYESEVEVPLANPTSTDDGQPAYFVDGVRFYGDPKTINLADIESFSEVKKSAEFPNGCIYITLKKKK
ncbi:MAG: TonB family protein [Bacteroidales bacterium]|nr:TonB family protein [Bacteroidales bacterium]